MVPLCVDALDLGVDMAAAAAAARCSTIRTDVELLKGCGFCHCTGHAAACAQSCAEIKCKLEVTARVALRLR